MNGLARRIVDALSRGPMLFGELKAIVGAEPRAIRKALEELVEAGLVRKRRSGRFWVYWLDGDGDGGNGHLDPRDWEMVEGLTVLQVLEEASRLS